MINPGTYRARALGPDHVKFGRAGTGTQQVAVTFMLYQEQFEGDDPTGEFEPTGEEITWIGSFTDKTAERTLESLGYAGWKGPDLADMSGIGSQDVDLVVEHEDYQGRPRAKVQWVNRPGGSKFKFKEELGVADFEQLRKRMKGLALSLKSGPGQASPAPRAASATRAPGHRPNDGRRNFDDAAHDGRDPGTGQHAEAAADDIPF